MKRIVNLVGTLLIAAGIVTLVYVGVTYERSKSTAASIKTPAWTVAQRTEARKLNARLAGHQTVAVPRRLAAALPPAGSEPALRIVIPKIAVDAPVIQTMPRNGVWDVVDWAVGHLATTANPGAPGNSALSAHDD